MDAADTMDAKDSMADHLPGAVLKDAASQDAGQVGTSVAEASRVEAPAVAASRVAVEVPAVAASRVVVEVPAEASRVEVPAVAAASTVVAVAHAAVVAVVHTVEGAGKP